MKLLFDQNISFRIVKKVIENFPGSKQVRELSLENSKDIEIWEYAKKNDFTIVTFDADFYDFSIVKGFPPKVLWFRMGNTSTINIERILKEKKSIIKEFIEADDIGCLEILE